MSEQLFLCIVADLKSRSEFFQQRWDARSTKGFSPIHTYTSAVRKLGAKVVVAIAVGAVVVLVSEMVTIARWRWWWWK